MPSIADGIEVDPLKFYHLWIRIAKKLSSKGEEALADKFRGREFNYTFCEKSDEYKCQHFFRFNIKDKDLQTELAPLITA